MNPELYKSRIPPVTGEFIAAMKEAFPNREPKVDTSMNQIQRTAGQQEVITWAIQFMRQRDISNPTGKPR